MEDLIASFEATRVMSYLGIAVDWSDEELLAYRKILRVAPPWVQWRIVQSDGMNAALNDCARWWAEGHEIVGFMGDDHRPRTAGWDEMLAQPILKDGMLFTYGNDLLQGPNLPTQVVMDSRVIQRLGHMSPPELMHLYLDNYWLTLGRQTGRIRYVSEAIVEHMHPVAGKAEWDANYVRVNDGSIYEHDGRVFHKYVEDGHMAADVAKVRDI
jgi:hypothetical protein